MKAKKFLNVALTCLWVSAWTSLANAAFDSGSTGADGALSPTANIQLQIPESGVFNFTTINIPSGVTVTFKKNTQNTPVSILASGDVTINGTISVNGSTGNYIIPGTGGAGGFDGGVGGTTYQTGKRGEGPGSGSGGSPRTDATWGAGGGGGGSYGGGGGTGGNYYNVAAGGSGGAVYGNERILPLIGGSGGGGGGGTTTYVGGSGGGGAGSILIASSGTITVSGSITANGGNGANGENNYAGGGGAGSGGSLRLIANIIAGNGTISATGGSGGYSNYYCSGAGGGVGRIRLEASSVTRTSATTPPFSMGYPYAVIPPNMPNLTIASIGGIDVPDVPKGSFGAPDIMLPFNTKNPITVVVTGANIPTGTTVTVKTSPAVGNAASATSTLSGTESSSSASVSLNVSTAYPSLITASVTYQLTASNGGPIYAEGEKVEWVRVATNLGEGSIVTYITESGREISVKM